MSTPTGPEGNAPTTTPAGDTANAAATLQTFFSKRILVVLALVLLAIAVILLLIGMFYPEGFANAFARTCLRICISLCLSAFFFVLFVQNVTVKVPFSAKGVASVSGPIAIFFILLYVLRFIVVDPLPPSARLFLFAEEGRITTLAVPANVQPFEKAFNWWLAKAQKDEYPGIVAIFPQGVTEWKGRVTTGFHKAEDFTFRRGEDLGTLNLIPNNK